MSLTSISYFPSQIFKRPTLRPKLSHLDFKSPRSRKMSSMVPEIRLAVLHQAIELPLINGIRKPMKPGGYQDSSADIAYTLSKSLSEQPSIEIHTPILSPSPTNQTHWSFPDTTSGIFSALRNGTTTHLWANTILFSAHPLQNLPALDAYQDSLRIIAQPPKLVETGDDKAKVNDFLRSYSTNSSKECGKFTLPQGWTIDTSPELDIYTTLKELYLPYPVVGKPIRGRGSFGVKVCHDTDSLAAHFSLLFKDSSSVMIEEYLSGEEATVTVMPPSPSHATHWALPIVTRFGHEQGVAPYNGIVAVTANSRVVTQEECEAGVTYGEVMKECEGVAKLLGATAPIRVDVRRFGKAKENGERFALFDVNMKPNMTGPGRPGRDDQASLTAIAAKGLGWDYKRLLREMIESAPTLRALREVELLL
ncbi:hypothetical protein ONS95_007834 [Cadophora gregata]|uniref:uncharacterized protein n=1 Tax=Cadophora gregata TaxID=51156 RepID=UPI0026DA7E24|nr:uncharacterized protein ONS95_007834 [Cadophora gregata]KAK0126220.1 hypothetical protein ONS95_007834 [Cadophora gregata]